MENQLNDYIEIENVSGFGMKLPDKFYSEGIPDVIVSNNPVELQEVYFSAQGKGHRRSYSYHHATSIDFNTNPDLLSPLKSKLHKHDYFELILIASDQFEMQVESQLCKFNKWDVCILNRSVRHSEYFKPEGKVFYLALSPTYISNWPQQEGISLHHFSILAKIFSKGLRDTFQQNKDFTAFRYTNQAIVPPSNGLIEDIRREFESRQPGYQLFIRGLLYRLFCILTDPQHYETEYVNLGPDEGFSLAFSAKQLLDKNKRKTTKLQIAERLNYSSEHINRIFKKHYGYTIPEYNRMVCMQQAAQALCNTDQHIHEICRQLGFTNRTHFYSLFEHEYGCTPSDYRRKYTKH